jgi:acetyl-CoA carboxylase biotin carboxyl carrier protein
MVRERVERGGEATPPSPRNSLSIAEIRQLITMMNGSDIEEIAVEHEDDGLKLVLRKPAPVALGLAGDGAPVDDFTATLEDVPAEDDADARQREIGAPLVGIFRSSMKVGGKPLVQTGDIVRQGQVIGAIEALNVYNEVEADGPGRIGDILVSDGQPVEYGQPLMVIESQTA